MDSINELLTQAKLRYPAGTIFLSCLLRERRTATNKLEISKNGDGDGGNAIITGGYCVWAKGSWAQILSKPEPKNVEHFQIY